MQPEIYAEVVRQIVAPLEAKIAQQQIELDRRDADLKELRGEVVALRERAASLEARPVVAGPPGADGKDGRDGVDGKDGAGLVYRGVWHDGNYCANDIVTHN